MSMAVSRRDGKTVITVSGCLDPEIATKLVALLEDAAAADATSSVVIDVALARQITAVALAVLSAVKHEVWPRVRFRGLSQHDERILQHLRADRR